MQLTSKVVIVTGGARGLGAEYARGIVAAGGRVAITDLNEQGAAELAAELGDHAMSVGHDASDADSWARAVAATEEAFGRIDGLVNNAGIPAPSKMLVDEPMDHFRRVIDVNLFSVQLGLQAVVPAMRRAGGGSIVNISSVAGLVGMAFSGSYGASKWAVRGMTKMAAVELAPEGIRVNSVQPGTIYTPMTAGDVSEGDGAFSVAAMGRVGRAEELLGAVVYLLSDAASYTTGAELTVDGGWTAGSSLATLAAAYAETIDR
ncbi:glucose 1-dehydrogenase [Microbacterium resistens]|uniref:Glucose 1-dehydrogenase n=1 Tax=Microbacterium resistens TaxID=156977 RepID=A0ABY3RVJ3_9MICO|nr:glucose 1-dehydrogenase [Microbacterium resistens]UGS27989.1 glucose 1-dehydrogenase [Microbacterium resistens]